MLRVAPTVHEGLLGGGRLPTLSRLGERLSATELVALVLAGCLAAVASAMLDLNLRVPGHAIIRAVFPMALGLALVPRHLAGTIMGTSALAAALGLSVAGVAGLGIGATASLCLTGPMLDIALARSRAGRQLYLRFVLAGIGSNLIAFAVQAAAKLLHHSGSRPFGQWLPVASVTYVLCGAAAGLVSALFWFRFHPPTGSRQEAKP